jgi:hypothetical protein
MSIGFLSRAYLGLMYPFHVICKSIQYAPSVQFVSNLQGLSPQALPRHEPSPGILLLTSQRNKVAASSSQFRGKALMRQSLVQAGWKKDVRELPF